MALQLAGTHLPLLSTAWNRVCKHQRDPLSVEADMSGVLEHDDGARNRSHELQNTSERLSKQPQRPVKVYTPYAARVEQIAPDGKVHASGVVGKLNHRTESLLRTQGYQLHDLQPMARSRRHQSSNTRWHPYWYAHVVKIFHVNVQHYGEHSHLMKHSVKMSGPPVKRQQK